ncbi:YopX superfamily protein [Streptococcus phage vB_SthS_VA460]|uniref:YopX superfamily protein n=1 Tax=Streptococcus phage vB_SthS_VA460 TaxID=2069609 RepID=A0A2I6QR17_9CAUD|nr:YopX superfamily protein [Streptococcus phage vB_SthS_VA460]AUN43423.1 YopX superfamily protein [Streptococcus phage vB_SthS_VA460]
MIPRYRAWNKEFKAMHEVNDIIAISFEDKNICVQTIYFERGLPDSRDLDYYDFDDIVLMQSTGLIDSVGKEIFEGDILSIESDEGNIRVIVYWDDKHALFMFEEKYNKKVALAELFEDNSYQFNIIGNIYENPELL